MAKYTFTKEPDETNEFDIATVKVQFETEQLQQVSESIYEFLLACGFSEAAIEKHIQGD